MSSDSFKLYCYQIAWPGIPATIVRFYEIKHKISLVIYGIFILMPVLNSNAQILADSTKHSSWWNFHFQNTVISQQHPGFHAKYAGRNSLDSTNEFHSSITITLYFGAKLWKGSAVYFNPELSGGEGFSQTTGIASFPNGEVYRVSDPKPHIYLARFYLRQIIPLSDEFKIGEDDQNQLPMKMPSSYFAITAGKFSLMDFYDNNKYSHDPRTQFYNWALMGNGAWDYAANTRGYTFGIHLELVKPYWTLRFATVMVSTDVNGSVMDPDLIHTGSQCLEFERNYSFGVHPGTIRLVSYLNRGNMGSYQRALKWGTDHALAPSIDSVHGTGRSKFGLGFNIEQELVKNVGIFIRAGWNDGHNETWQFTEIDRSASLGFYLSGNIWNRKDDNMGIAQIVNGISGDHKNYLKAGGYGFIIGDGRLNYGPEVITEWYYSFYIENSHVWFSPDYQLIINPAYNKDRGPVHVFGMRMHVEF